MPPGVCIPLPLLLPLLLQELCNVSLYVAIKQDVLHDPVSREPNMEAILALLLDIADGMAYLHRNNIVHGDISASDILIKVCVWGGRDCGPVGDGGAG